MSKPTKHVTIIGGGIAGLASAYYLQKHAADAGISLTYTLLEKADHLGGKIVTSLAEGYIIEGGPDSFISQKPWAYQLAQELGLGDRLIGTNDERRKTFVVHKGKLQPLPDGVMLIIPTRFMPFALSPLISPLGKLRMGFDLFIPPKMDDRDESLADFINRRLGKEALEKIAEPLMAGIYVADPYQLSLKSTFPRFIAMEQKHGSLIKGMLSQMNARRQAATTAAKPKLPLFMTFRGGLSEFVETIVSNLNGDLRPGVGVTTIEHQPDAAQPYTLQLTGGQTLTTDAVVMAIPAPAAASLLETHVPAATDDLRRIRYLSTATVSIAYSRADIGHPLDGFGFVVPKTEDCRLMACTWVSTKFDGRTPQDRVLLRVFVGGYKNETLVDLSDEEMLALVREELRKLMGITAEPVHHEIYHWRKSNAQYDVGHLERVERIEAAVTETLPGLYLTGSAFRGVGLPDCIHQADLAVGRVVADLLEKNA